MNIWLDRPAWFYSFTAWMHMHCWYGDPSVVRDHIYWRPIRQVQTSSHLKTHRQGPLAGKPMNYFVFRGWETPELLSDNHLEEESEGSLDTDGDFIFRALSIKSLPPLPVNSISIYTSTFSTTYGSSSVRLTWRPHPQQGNTKFAGKYRHYFPTRCVYIWYVTSAPAKY
jgi:hypothetical protein